MARDEEDMRVFTKTTTSTARITTIAAKVAIIGIYHDDDDDDDGGGNELMGDRRRDPSLSKLPQMYQDIVPLSAKERKRIARGRGFTAAQMKILAREARKYQQRVHKKLVRSRNEKKMISMRTQLALLQSRCEELETILSTYKKKFGSIITSIGQDDNA
eukprot:m.126613 g.126613  ORF g.126613 m.126613 type:complete len:159 (-) comp9434_c2_seq1:1342-1818(-)